MDLEWVRLSTMFNTEPTMEHDLHAQCVTEYWVGRVTDAIYRQEVIHGEKTDRTAEPVSDGTRDVQSQEKES